MYINTPNQPVREKKNHLPDPGALSAVETPAAQMPCPTLGFFLFSTGTMSNLEEAADTRPPGMLLLLLLLQVDSVRNIGVKGTWSGPICETGTRPAIHQAWPAAGSNPSA